MSLRRNYARHGRWPSAVLWMAVGFCLPGCVMSKQMFQKMPFAPGWNSEEQCVLPPNAGLEEVIAHLNANSRQLRGWRSTDVRIQTPGPGGIPLKLSAVIAVEQPQNFRLRARSLAGDEADFGSNAERFWFWLRRAQPSYVFTAEHRDLPAIASRMQIPFQPDWVMEALGVVPLDASKFTLERQGNEAATAKLISDRLSASGQPVRQVLVVDTCRGVIRQHRLHDIKGRLIAEAVFDDHKPCGETGIVLPHHVELHWPDAETKLALKMATIDVNPVATVERTWLLPEIAGSPPFDMGQRQRRMAGQDAPSEPQQRREERMALEHPLGRRADLSVAPEDSPFAEPNPFEPPPERSPSPFGHEISVSPESEEPPWDIAEPPAGNVTPRASDGQPWWGDD